MHRIPLAVSSKSALSVLLLIAMLPAAQGATRAHTSSSARSTGNGIDDSGGIDRLIDPLFSLQDYAAAAISPDARSVAWVKSPVRAGSASKILLRGLNRQPASVRQITAGRPGGSYSEQQPAWSPDSKSIAFLSDARTPGQEQLYVATPGRRLPARKLTALTGFLTDPEWAPDGKTVAVLFTENAPRAGGPLQPMTPDAGVVESHVYEQRVALVDVASGRVRQLSPPDFYVYEYNWSPDSGRIACIAARGSGDNNWWIAELYTINLQTGEFRSIAKPSAQVQLAVPRWSPDGNSIAFIGGLMSDQGSTGGDIYSVPASGGEPRNLTPSIAASPNWIAWQKPNEILFSENVDGGAGFAALDPETGKVDTLWAAPEAVSSGAFAFYPGMAADGRSVALIRESFSRPPEVWAGPIGNWKQITSDNRDQQAAWREAKSIHWKSNRYTVQGWLLYPKPFDPERKYPMVTVVHGGPAACARPRWPRSFFGLQLLSSQGYFVFYPNPRGSYGQGESFARANVKDFGYGDLQDIDAGIDHIIGSVPVDRKRIGITGWSYGGFMTMWAVTETNRFRAAAAGAGIANWQSYYGENDIDRWMIPYFGASVYDDPSIYAKSSPIDHIKNVKTPTLILVGDRDGECPVPQSYEFWHALKTLGVDTQFVVYPGEGHFIYKHADQRDIMKRVLSWFNSKMSP